LDMNTILTHLIAWEDFKSEMFLGFFNNTL
jgi:hypothetical protein